MVSFFWALVIFLQLRGMSCQKKGGEGEREEGRGGRERKEERKREGGREGREGGEGEREEGRDERMVGVCEGGEFELTWDKRICSLHLGGLILLTFAEP